MKKVIATLAMVLLSQTALAEIGTYSGNLHLVAIDESGAFSAITGDLAQVMFDNLKTVGTPGKDIKANKNFLCGIASVGMSCVTGLKDITAMENAEIEVTSLFDTEDAVGLVLFGGADAVKVYDGMAKVEELDKGLKIGNEFLCVKSENADESACMMVVDVNGKHAPTLAQAQKAGLKLPILK